MNTGEIVIFILLIILLIVGIGLTIYFVVRHDNSKKITNGSGSNNGSGSGNGQNPLTPLQSPLTPLQSPLTPLQPPGFTPLQNPLTPLQPPNLIPLPGPPIRTIGNPLIQEIYDAISPSDNGKAAYELLLRYQNQLTNLTPFEYGIAAGLGYYNGVYTGNLSPNTSILAIQALLLTYYSAGNLADAWCGVRFTFDKAGYPIPNNWANIIICN